MKGNVNFSETLRDLSRQHFRRAIDLDEYRCERRKVLDNIDQYFNGNAAPSIQSAAERSQLDEYEDATVPYRRPR